MSGESDDPAPSKPHVRRRLQGMDPDEFEYFVADVWERLGWRTQVVGEPGDRGIDVIATRGEQKQLLQAKRYGANTTVGSPEVQQYASLRLQEDAVDGVTIVTTGAFSRQAEDLAPDLDVLLVDGEELLGMLEEIDGWDIVAAYIDGLDLATESSPSHTSSTPDRRRGEREQPHTRRDTDRKEGVFARLRSWFG